MLSVDISYLNQSSGFESENLGLHPKRLALRDELAHSSNDDRRLNRFDRESRAATHRHKNEKVRPPPAKIRNR